MAQKFLNGILSESNITLDDGAGASPKLILKNSSDETWEIFNGTHGVLNFYEGSDLRLSFAQGGDATFAGDVTLSAAGSTGEIIRTTDNTEPYFALQRNSGSNGVGVLRLLDGGDLTFDTGATGAGQTTRLTIDGATGNATFAGNVGVGAANSDGDSSIGTPKLHVKGSGGTGRQLVARFEGASDSNDSYASIIINHPNDRGLILSGGRASSNRAIGFINLMQYDGTELVDGITLHQPDAASEGGTTGTNVGIGTTAPGYKLEIAEDTNGTADLLFLRNSDATYAQTWGFQSDTNKDLVITGSSGSGGFKFVPGSRGTTFTGSVTATNFILTGTDGFNLPSGGFVDWANGDARIIEGLVNNYSLSFQTYNGSATTTALRLDGDNTAIFAGKVTTTKLHDYDTIPANQNLLDIGSIKIANRDDIYGNATKTVITDYVAKYVNDNTGGTTIRIYVDDNILVDGDAYMVSVYYENLIGELTIDLADETVTGNGSQTGTSSAPKSGRIYGYATRADYTSTYRFVDINLSGGSGHEVTLHSPKVEAGTTLTDFVATERTDMPTNSMHVKELIATGGLKVIGPASHNFIQSENDYTLGFNDSTGASQWWIKNYTNGNFAIHENNVGDKFTIAAGGNATFAGIINAPDGSATTPAYNFTSHAGNGMYLEDYDATNNKEQVSWATDGTRRAWVNEPGLWTANNLYFAGQLRKFGEWHATSGTAGEGFKFENTADSTTPLTLTSAGNATFAGTLKALGGLGGYYMHAVRGNSSPGGNDPAWAILNNTTISSATYGWGWYDSNVDGSFQLWRRNNSTTANHVLTFDRGNSNATFAGTVKAATSFIADAVSTANNDPGADNVQVSGYGMIGNRGNLYITNASTSGSATVQIGVGGVHNGSPKLSVGASVSSISTNLHPGADSTYNVGSNTSRFANGYFDTLYGDGSNLTGVTVSNADTVDSLHAASFIRSDDNDTASGVYTLTNSTTSATIQITGQAGASNYNYFLNANNDGGTKAVHFVNGSTRTADGGANAYVIRNDGGKLILGTSSQDTLFPSVVKIKNSLIDNVSVTSATTTTVVASISGSTYAAVFFDYVAYKSSNIRAGIVTACSDGSSVSFTETSTTDLGDTSDVTLSVDISGGNFRLLATTASNTWTIKSLIRAI